MQTEHEGVSLIKGLSLSVEIRFVRLFQLWEIYEQNQVHVQLHESNNFTNVQTDGIIFSPVSLSLCSQADFYEEQHVIPSSYLYWL